jgi:hypothetical protein
MRKPEPTARDLADAKKSQPVHHPETDIYRESWSVVNPRGHDVYFGSYDEALAAAQTGIY